MGGSFSPTQWAGCKCGWSAGLRVGVPLWSTTDMAQRLRLELQVWSVPENGHAVRYREQGHALPTSIWWPGWESHATILYAVMAYRATKHSASGFTPNFMMFGREVSELLDMVAGLPPDSDTATSVPEYVKHLREHPEMLSVSPWNVRRHKMTRSAATVSDWWCCVVTHQRHMESQEQGQKVPPVVWQTTLHTE